MSNFDHRGPSRAGAADRDGAWSSEAGVTPCRTIPMVDAQLDSRDLFAAGRLITIAHGEHTYQLRLTAQNKLILTK